MAFAIHLQESDWIAPTVRQALRRVNVRATIVIPPCHLSPPFARVEAGVFGLGSPA